MYGGRWPIYLSFQPSYWHIDSGDELRKSASLRRGWSKRIIDLKGSF